MPITSSTTWTYYASSDPCVYRMRVYSTFRWVLFIDDAVDWYWWYEPVANADDTAAFEYGGLLWTYHGQGPNIDTEAGIWSVECPDEVTPEMWYC